MSQEENINKPEKCFSFRHIQMLVLFIGLSLACGMRVTMSVAIVAMTNYDRRIDTDLSPLNWGTLEQTVVLFAFMAGYVVSQVAGRRVAARFGGKVLVAVGVAGSAALAGVIPLGVWDGGWILVSACRAVQGVAQGAIVPAVLNLIDSWIPVDERKLTEAIMSCAMLLGVSFEFVVSGFVINAWDWPMAFYMNTITGIVWSIVFIIFGSDSAEKSKFISEKEKEYVVSSLKHDSEPKDLTTPWYALWTTLPFLSLVVANCGHSWGLWTLMTLLPTYLYQTQELDIEMNGVIAAIPFIAMILMILPFRYISNLIIKKQCLSITTTRKVCSGIGFVGPAVSLLVLGLFQFDVITTAGILTLGMALNGGQYSGFMQAHEDMAPNFSRRMRRITSGFADLISVFAPLTAGVMVVNSVQSTWESVFNLSASMYIVCGIIYIVFGTSERQQWNEPNSVHISSIMAPKEGNHSNREVPKVI